MDEGKGHVGTGLIGGQWLMRVLTDNGRPDIGFTIAQQRDYPSWGYMYRSLARPTIWELWNGNTADPGMNSHNHVMLLGDLLVWFYERSRGHQLRSRRPGIQEDSSCTQTACGACFCGCKLQIALWCRCQPLASRGRELSLER